MNNIKNFLQEVGFYFSSIDILKKDNSNNTIDLIFEIDLGDKAYINEIVFSGDHKVDGKVKNAVEMMQRLGRSDRARQSFIRHLFRYFMGRNEVLSDSKTLIEAEEAYVNTGGSFKALVVSLLSSDSFLYRR